ncbi:MAG: TonB-dependent receptor [Burkholderiaceae bacterium]|nr:MAG: TonB-dependent receptor [Burkholderiaceae bacterium]
MPVTHSFCKRFCALVAGAHVLAVPAWANVAEIVSLSGRGETRPPQEVQWREARVQQRVEAGHFVRTGDQSSMALLFADKTQMRLAQNSLFQVKSTVGTTGAPVTLQLRQGRAWTQSKSGPGRVQMETPTAIAAIQGTDWIMEVDEAGNTRLIVLHGQVQLYNDHGSVTVQGNEQARVAPGQAPVKLLLLNPADRVQWIGAYRVDPQIYPELRETGNNTEPGLRALGELLRTQRLPEAHGQLLAWVAQGSAPAAAYLLLADFALAGSRLDEAGKWLGEGAQRYPADVRFSAQGARLALLRGNAGQAGALLDASLQRQPDALELHLARAELARYQGQAGQARAAYVAATSQAPEDARGWHGLGRVDAEREDLRTARPSLERALALDASQPGLRGELATLEARSHHWERARAQFDEALRTQPDDYVAWTGRGLMQLQQGDAQAALDSLLRASVIEPSYARAIVYKAVAYHQLGQQDVALQTLAQAAELDPLDPLPHQLAGLIHTDRADIAQAVVSAREAMRRLPYLKSLNQLANDQKGAANLGSALAAFGLEDWARRYAQQSYTPFWGGSHLFLADRYAGRFTQQSELMQGFVTDPLAFGVSGRHNSLLLRPGSFATASLQASRNTDLTVMTPTVAINGYANAHFPLAWFAEGSRIGLQPRGEVIDGHGKNFTAAVGLMPHEALSLFVFANRFSADIDLTPQSALPQRFAGAESRVDVGLNYRFGPAHQAWLKLGGGRLDARFAGYRQSIHDQQQNLSETADLQWRHSRGEDNGLQAWSEWTWGVEVGRSTLYRNTESAPHPGALPRVLGDTRWRDRSNMLYAQRRAAWSTALELDVSVFWQNYRIAPAFQGRIESVGGVLPLDKDLVGLRRSGLFPRVGLVWSPTARQTWRLAYQDWLHPASASTLSPVATAGLVQDDQTVLPGGRQRRLRLQWERELSDQSFVMAFADTRRIDNPGLPGEVLNTRVEANDLDRLRNRAALNLRSHGDALEQISVFQQGRVQTLGASVNHLLQPTLSVFAQYTATHSRNTSSFFQGLALPYMPRHRLGLGATWQGPDRLLLQVQAIYRTHRFTTEYGGDPIPSGWDMALSARWQTQDRRWAVEAFAQDLLHPQRKATLGLQAVWRY